jgi:hypothetical protein
MSPAAFVIAIVALIVATSSGTAYAVLKIGTKNIKSGAVTSAKIKNETVKSVDVRNGGLELADLSTATRNALQIRAWGTVDPSTPSLVAGRTRGITGVTRPATGVYCLTLDPALGIDVTKVSVSVTPEWGGSTGDTLQPYWYANASGCAAGQVEVYTEKAATSSNTVAFSVIIP